MGIWEHLLSLQLFYILAFLSNLRNRPWNFWFSAGTCQHMSMNEPDGLLVQTSCLIILLVFSLVGLGLDKSHKTHMHIGRSIHMLTNNHHPYPAKRLPHTSPSELNLAVQI